MNGDQIGESRNINGSSNGVETKFGNPASFSPSHDNFEESRMDFIEILRSRVQDCQARCAQLMATTDHTIRQSFEGFSRETRASETHEIYTRSESGIDCSNQSRDDVDQSPHSKSAPTLDIKVLEQFEQATASNLELSKDIEQLLSEWRTTRSFFESSMDPRDSDKEFQELVALKLRYNAEKSQWLERISDLNVQNERKRQLLAEKEQIINSLSKQSVEPNDPSFESTATKMELLYQAVLDIGNLIVQEAELWADDDNSLLHQNRAISKLKEISDQTMSANDLRQKDQKLTNDVIDSIFVSLKFLMGKRRIEKEDLVGKYTACKEQIKIQRKFIDDTGDERKKLLKINAQLADQLTEMNRDLLLNNNRTSTPSTSSKADNSAQVIFLDHVKTTLKEQIEALNSENDKLHYLANDFRKGREILEDELEEMRSRERNFKWEIDQRSRDLARLEKQLESSRTEVLSLKTEVASVKSSSEAIDHAKNELYDQLRQLQHQKDNIENELTFVKGAEASLRSSIKSEQQHNEKLLLQIEQLKKDVSSYKESNSKLMKEKLAVDAALKLNERNYVELKEELQKIIKVKENIEEELKEAKENDGCQRKLYDELKREATKQFGALSAEVDELTKQLEELVAENQRLKEEKLEMRSQQQELLRMKESTEDSLRRLHKQLSASQEQLESLHDQLNGMKMQKSAIEMNAGLLNNQVITLQSELEALNITLKRTSEENQELHKVKISLANKINALQKEYEQKLAEERQFIENMRHDFAMEKSTMEAKNDEFISQLKMEKERCIGDYQEELSKVKMELQVMEGELSDKLNTLEREKLNLELSYQKEINSLKEKLNDADNLIRQKETNITAFSEKLHQLEEDKRQLQVKSSSDQKTLQQEIVGLKKVVAENKDVFDTLNNRILHLEEENKSLSSKLKCVEEENKTLQQNLTLKTEKLSQAEKECLQKMHDISTLQDSLKSLEKEKKEKDGEILRMKDALTKEKEESERMMALVEEYDAKMKQVEAANRQTLVDLEEIRSTLMDVEKSRLELKKQVNNAKVLHKALENELNLKTSLVEEMKLTVGKCEVKYQKKQEEIHSLKQTIVELEAAVHTLRTESSNLKHKLSEYEHLLNIEKATSKNQHDECRRLEKEYQTTNERLNSTSENLLFAEKSLQTAEQSLSKMKQEVSKLSSEKSEIEETLRKFRTAYEMLPRMLDLRSERLNDDQLIKTLTEFTGHFETIIRERDEATLKCTTLEKSARDMSEILAELKTRTQNLEQLLTTKEKSIKMLTNEAEKLKKQQNDQEESLEKLQKEKQYLCGRLAELCAQVEKIEKEKKKLMRELQTLRSTSASNEKQLAEASDKNTEKIKMLEETKCALDDRVSTLMKEINEITTENESLKREVQVLKKTMRNLQSSNLQLHTALSDSNIALQRSNKEEKELKRKISTLLESKEENNAVSQDVLHQLNRLKQHIDDLTTERESLQVSLESQRNLVQNLKETNRVLAVRVRQMEAELNLTLTKLSENEAALQVKEDAVIARDAKIIELEEDCRHLREKNKQLSIQQKTLLRSSPKQNPRKSLFLEESDAITQGLAALEEENTNLQRKVKSLQSLVTETEFSQLEPRSPNLDLSKLKRAQLQAESLLETRERTSEVNAFKGQLSSIHITPSSCITQNDSRNHYVTSTPKDVNPRRKLKY